MHLRVLQVNLIIRHITSFIMRLFSQTIFLNNMKFYISLLKCINIVLFEENNYKNLIYILIGIDKKLNDHLKN